LAEDIDSADQPATRNDLDKLREDVNQLRGAVREDMDQLRSEMNHQYRDVVERIANAQTELLKAFYGLCSGKQQESR